MTADELRLIEPHPDNFWNGSTSLRIGAMDVEFTVDDGRTIWFRAFRVGFPSRVHPKDHSETMRIATFFLN